MNELAEEQGFLVLYPGQPTSAHPQRCWKWFSASDQRRGRGEPSIIAGMTRSAIAEFALDPTRVYVAGMSAGAAAAAIMGSEYPDLYAAVGVHSGLAFGSASDLPSALVAMRGSGTVQARGTKKVVPTIVFHGNSDKTVHPVNGEQVIAQQRGKSSRPLEQAAPPKLASNLPELRTPMTPDESGWFTTRSQEVGTPGRVEVRLAPTRTREVPMLAERCSTSLRDTPTRFCESQTRALASLSAGFAVKQAAIGVGCKNPATTLGVRNVS